MTTKPQSTTEETSVNVHALTVFVCQDCIDLKGVMCNNAECVFCRRTMVEVQKLLDAMLLCPIVDGKRLILVGDAVTNEDTRISPASAAPVVDDYEQRGEIIPEEEIQAAIAASKERLHWPFTAKHDNCAECDKEYEAPPAAATAAPQVADDLLRDAGAIIIVNEGSAGARVEIRFAELQDAQRLHQALAQMRAAAPVDHNSIPLTTYERMLTIEWDKYNARRHELIKAERSRVLSESEVLELFELQWLARIKHGLSSGPRVTQKQPLPDRFLCINPEEQPTVISFLRGYGADADRELARLHLNLCLRCQELANAAPMEQSDSSIPTCPDCQQGYICEHCGKSIIDYCSGNEGAR